MKDSALFTGVTREMGKGGVGGAPLHIFSCPAPPRSWETAFRE